MSVTWLSSKRFTLKGMYILTLYRTSVIILAPPPKHTNIHSIVKLCKKKVFYEPREKLYSFQNINITVNQNFTRRNIKITVKHTLAWRKLLISQRIKLLLVIFIPQTISLTSCKILTSQWINLSRDVIVISQGIRLFTWRNNIKIRMNQTFPCHIASQVEVWFTVVMKSCRFMFQGDLEKEEKSRKSV